MKIKHQTRAGAQMREIGKAYAVFWCALVSKISVHVESRFLTRCRIKLKNTSVTNQVSRGGVIRLMMAEWVILAALCCTIDCYVSTCLQR